MLVENASTELMKAFFLVFSIVFNITGTAISNTIASIITVASSSIKVNPFIFFHIHSYNKSI